MKKTAAIAIAFGLSASSALADTKLAGDPVSSATVADRLELVRIADALDAAVDAKDWTLARSLFADTIRVDFTSLVGGEPGEMPADNLIAGWSGNLTQEKTSFHLRGNHRLTFTGADSATMLSHGYAWNRMERGARKENGGEALWEVWGTYRHDFERSGKGWLITGMTFNATAQRGNSFVRDTPGN